MASQDEEARRLQALDARRNAGADAWSPSRAREAIDRFFGPDGNGAKMSFADPRRVRLEFYETIHSPSDFGHACWIHLGLLGSDLY